MGPDPNGDMCDGGWRLNESYGQPRDRIYTHSSRGHERTSCVLADNTLGALWTEYPTGPPVGRYFGLKVEGSVSCSSTGASTCDPASGGYLFVMRCVSSGAGEGLSQLHDRILCEGGVNGKVYIY